MQPDQPEPTRATFGDMDSQTTFGAMEGPVPEEAPAQPPAAQLPPLGESRVQDGTPATEAGEVYSAPEIEDFEIEEAPPEELQGGISRILPDFTEMVEESLRRFAQGDRLRYETAALPVPSADQTQMTMGAAIHVEMPGTVLNTIIGNTIMMPNIGSWDQASLDREVRNLLETTRQMRSGQLEAMMQAQEAARAAQNGQGRHNPFGNGNSGPPPGGGLIIPG